MIKKSNAGHPFTLGKGERLKSRKLIDRIFREGQRFTLYPFRVHYCVFGASSTGPDPTPMPAQANPLPGWDETPVRAGFGASSRNFKKAVDRNRIKRLTREAYRLQKQALYDHLIKEELSMAVFFIYTGKEVPDHGMVAEKIAVALQKLIKEVAA